MLVMLDLFTVQEPGRCRIFFNTSANVGIGQQNDPLDVVLVQYGYVCMANNPQSGASPAEKAIYLKITPGTPYSGRPDDVLSQAILAHQTSRGTIRDGHVSRMRGGGSYAGARGKEPFILIALSNNIFDLTTDVWPRIDKAGTCPPALAAAVRQMFRN